MHRIWTSGVWLVGVIEVASALAFSNSSQSTSPATSDLAWLRSPQCSSSYSSYFSAHSSVSYVYYNPQTVTVAAGSLSVVPTNPNAAVTITGPATTTIPAFSTALSGLPDPSACCGGCFLNWANVNVRYFPAPGANYDCLGTATEPSWDWGGVVASTQPLTRTPANTGNIPIPFPTTTAPTNIATLNRRGNNSELIYDVGPDGFTYTSPYIYVVFSTIYAEDACGPRGGLYTSLTWSFLPGQLSTIDGRANEVEASNGAVGGIPGTPKSFNLADLPCPPASITTADWYNYHPQDGDLYRPILAPMPQLYELDPLFKGCYIDLFEGLDPPFALQPQTGLAITTSAPPPPISTPPTPGPPPTGTTQAIPLTSEGALGVQTNSATSNSLQQQGGLGSVQFSANQPDPTSVKNGPAGPVNTDPGSSPSTSDNGAISINAGISTNNVPTSSPSPAIMSYSPVIIGSETVSLVSSAAVIGTQTVLPGSVATIGSNTVSFAAGGSAIVVDGTTVTPVPAAQTTPIIIAQQTASQQANGNLVIGGATLTRGGPAVTVTGSAGTQVVSVASDGNSLVIGGSSTIALPKATNQPGIGGVVNSVWNGVSPASTTLGNGTIINTGAAPTLRSVSIDGLIKACFGTFVVLLVHDVLI